MKIVNKLNLDSPVSTSEHGSWHYARNVQISDLGDYSENEDGTVVVSNYTIDSIYLGKIIIPDDIIVFHYILAKNHLSITRVNNPTFKVIIEDSRYKDNKVIGTYIYNNKGELIITFGCRNLDVTAPEILVVNLTTCPSVIVPSREENMYSIAPNYFIKPPTIDIDVIAGNLNTGTYFAAMQYEDENGNLSDFSNITRPIIINNIAKSSISGTKEYLLLFRAWQSYKPVGIIGKPKWTNYDFDGATTIKIKVGDYIEIIYLGKGLVIRSGMPTPDTIYGNIKTKINDKNNGRGLKINNTYFKFEFIPLINAAARIGDNLFKVITTGEVVDYSIAIEFNRDYNIDEDGTNEFYNVKLGDEASQRYTRTHILNITDALNYSSATTNGEYNFDDLENRGSTVMSGEWITKSQRSYGTVIDYPKMLKSGQQSNMGIKFKLSNLNTNYNKLRLAILYYEQQVLKEVRVTNTIDYNLDNITYNFTTLNTLNLSSVDSIVINKAKYTRAKSIESHANKLLLANFYNESNHFNDFQKVANKVKITPNTSKQWRPNSDVQDNVISTYSNPVDLYNYQPFKYGEVYCFFIAFNSIKGGIISVNHIPNFLGGNMKVYLSENTYPAQLEEIGGYKMRFHTMPEWYEANGLGNIYNIRVLGINVSNVVIPDELKEICGSWTIFYVERNNSNITRLTQGFVPGHKAGDKYHIKDIQSFDLYYNKYPSRFIKSIKRVMSVNTLGVNDINGVLNYTNDATYIGVNEDEITVNKVEYLTGIDSTSGDNDRIVMYDQYNNRLNVISEGVNPLMQPGIYDIITHNINIYSDLLTSILISTGRDTPSNETSITGLYGGDVVLSRNSIRLCWLNNYGEEPNQSSVNPTKPSGSRILYYFSEHLYNTELRHEGSEPYQKIYPQSTNEVIYAMPTRYGSYIKDDLGDSYDLTYSKIANVQAVSPDVKEFDSIFKNRVATSDVMGGETEVIGWKNFRVNNYIDVGLNRGEIVKLTSADKQLYIQCLYSVFLATVKDVLKLQDGSEAYLGTGDVFDRAPQELLYDNSGLVGCRDYDSIIYSPFGYIVCDRGTNAVYLLGQEVMDITNSGFKKWFTKNNINYNDDIVSIVYDYERKRLLIRHNGNYVLSYSFITKGATSFHDHIYIDSASNRTGTYLIGNTNTRKFTNVPGILPSCIDVNVMFNQKSLIQSIIWQTEYEINDNKLWDKTIDEIMIYNDTQCTGLLPVNNNKMWYNKEGGNYNSEQWYFNNLKDAVLNDREPFLEEFEPNSNVNPLKKNSFDMSQFISKFVTIRLKCNNQSNQRLKFVNLFVEIIKDPR
ncbi:hypothetical protein DSECCO2_120010 [anaerobic digester metagenome]